MRFGVAFPSRIGDHGLVALAEELGYEHAWFYDSQMIYSDVYATMALAAHRTKRIRLGTGVAVPSTRLAPVIAHSIATVHELAPGRVELGIGSGNTARLTMGLRPLRLSELKREVRTIRALLDGKTAMLEAEGERHPIRLLHPDGGFVRLEPRIPITLSALGPKTLAWCGAEGDAHLTWGGTPESIAGARGALAAAAHDAGREPETIPTQSIFGVALLRDGEPPDSPRALEEIAPFVTNYLHVQVEWGGGLLPVSPEHADVVERYRRLAATKPAESRHLWLHEGHLVYVRPDERAFVVPELAHAVSLIGTPDELIERIRALERAGLSAFAFQVTHEPERQIRDFARLVMDRY